MEERWNDTKLTDFLQRETDKHKMYPSDKLWRNIQQELHGKKTWPALTVISVLIITALTISTIIYDHPTHTNFNTVSVENLGTLTTEKQKNKHTNTSKQNNTVYYAENVRPSVFSAVGVVETEEPANQSTDNISLQLASNDLNDNSVITENAPANTSIDEAKKQLSDNLKNDTKTAVNSFESKKIDTKESLLPIVKGSIVAISTKTKDNSKLILNNLSGSVSSIMSNTAANEYSSVNDFIADLGYEKIIVFKQKKRASKFELQFYATPSISYRKLIDDKTRNFYEPAGAANGPIAPIYSLDVNDVVRHKPALGIEVGAGVLYKLSNRFKLKAGLQFNVRKYYIDSYKGGLNVASIAIIRNNRLDTISQFTSLSANGGYAETQLDSKLYQVSVPIGIQWQALQLKRFGISLSGTVQPTLTLNKNVYLISTDYKYYTDGTPFFRKWNINTSLELNLTYKIGNFNWYLGPQLRYQHLPTYTDKYPVKEHRLDYGLRVGFTKQLFK